MTSTARCTNVQCESETSTQSSSTYVLYSIIVPYGRSTIHLSKYKNKKEEKEET